METEQVNIDTSAETGLTETEQPETDWIIRRPRRAKLTAEESLKRMQAFGSERMENFIASVRKSKS